MPLDHWEANLFMYELFVECLEMNGTTWRRREGAATKSMPSNPFPNKSFEQQDQHGKNHDDLED
jgi:hypothetical protein